MFVREVLASVFAAILFFSPALLALFIPTDTIANNSWQRGVVLMPVLFLMAVPIIWWAGRYLLSKGIFTLMRFTVRGVILASSLVAIVMAPAIVVGGVVGLYSWTSAILGGLVVASISIVASIPAVLAWWWIVAHNQEHHYTTASGAGPLASSRPCARR